MKLAVQQVLKHEWEKHCAVHAHRVVFGEIMPPEYDRIDYALLVLDTVANKPVGYITCRELDQETVYLKHGGAFPPIKDTVLSYSAFLLALAWLRERYKRITQLVENTNVTYLKMSMSARFRVIGLRNFQGLVLLELYTEGKA